jgi:hypothetical protein
VREESKRTKKPPDAAGRLFPLLNGWLWRAVSLPEGFYVSRPGLQDRWLAGAKSWARALA